jgi:hypothetical protein
MASTLKKSSLDRVIDLFKPDVDITLIQENLKLTAEERVRKLEAFMEFMESVQSRGKGNGS